MVVELSEMGYDRRLVIFCFELYNAVFYFTLHHHRVAQTYYYLN